MSINYFGCLNVCEAFFPLLKSNAKVINIASRLGLLCRLPSPELKQRILKIEKIEQLTQIVNEYILVFLLLDLIFLVTTKNDIPTNLHISNMCHKKNLIF